MTVGTTNRIRSKRMKAFPFCRVTVKQIKKDEREHKNKMMIKPGVVVVMINSILWFKASMYSSLFTFQLVDLLL